MLEVGRLRALLAMSEHGGSSGAARALGRPPGDVAGQLSDWERELGLPLVDGDRLTPAGRRLAEHAGTLLGQLESAESDAAAVAGRVAGTLRVGVGADAGRVLLADTLATLRSSDVRLHLRQLAEERVGALDSTLDAVLVGEYGAAVPHRPDAAVERRELFTEPLLLAVPSRHRATGASVRLAELAGEAWIVGAGDTLVALERAAAGAGFAPWVVAEVGEDALALTLVAAGLGVALVPASAAPSPAEGVRFLTVLDSGLRRTVVAAVRRTRIADPAVRRLLDALAGAARRVAAAVPGVTAAVAPTPPAPPPAEPGRRPDPLFDPLPPEPAPRSNGRRDPWADRVRPEGLDLPGRNGTNGADLPPRNGTPAFGPDHPVRNGSLDHPAPGPAGRSDLPGRNGTPDPLGYSGPADLPGRPGPPDLPGRPGPADRPGRNGSPDPLGYAGPADVPGRPGPADRPGRNGTPDPLGYSGPADLPGRPGPADPSGRVGSSDHTGLGGPEGRPGLGGPADVPGGAGRPGRNGPSDLPGYGGPADRPGRAGPADPPGRNGAPGFGGPGDRSGLGGPADGPGRPGSDLPGSDLPGYGPADLPGRSPADPLPALEPPTGDVPGAGPGRRNGAAGAEPEFDDLSGLSGLSGFSGRPSGRRDGGGAEAPERGSGLPGRPAGGSGFGDAGALPPPGAVPGRDTGPGAETPMRGTSPYRTPPPTGDVPDFTPDLPSRSGPNPYRPDSSGHPAPDPFRTTGAEPGPNPYRGGQPRRDSLGGSELFTATQRPGATLPPGDAGLTTGRRSRARGGDGAEGTLPPAPAGAADDVRLSIFEDLQSEWFVQRESGTKAESWQMAADDGWAAAARLAEPTTAGTTTAGLPRRRPQAMVVPGAVGGPAAPGAEVPPPPTTTHRSPQEVRGRLSSYRDGVRRGRHAQRPADEE
jgi:DNA-binding transcriptional LysR family regulator